MSIYFSSGAFSVAHPVELLEAARKEAIMHIEWSAGMDDAPNFLPPILKASGEMHFMVHNYFPPPPKHFVLNLASLDEISHLQTMSMCRNAIDLCAQFGAPFYSVHSGWAFQLETADLGQPERQQQIISQQAIDVSKAYEQFISSIQTLSDWARRKGLRLLVENNVIAPSNMIKKQENILFNTHPNAILRFFEDVADDNVGLLLDFGHLAVSANALGFDPLEATQSLAPLVHCLHLSDNDGRRDNNQLIHKDTWFLPLLHNFRHLPWVIEVYHLSPSQRRAQHDLLLNFRN